MLLAEAKSLVAADDKPVPRRNAFPKTACDVPILPCGEVSLASSIRQGHPVFPMVTAGLEKGGLF